MSASLDEALTIAERLAAAERERFMKLITPGLLRLSPIEAHRFGRWLARRLEERDEVPAMREGGQP